MSKRREHAAPPAEDQAIRAALLRIRHQVPPADWDTILRRAETAQPRRTAARFAPRALVLALGVVAAVLAGWGWWRATSRVVHPSAPEAAPGLTTWNDHADGLSVRYPVGWSRATGVLTPGLSDPREILSIGTGPLVGDEGGNMPAAAVAAMDEFDVFISLQEGSPAQAPLSQMQPRRRFDLTRTFHPQQGGVEGLGRAPGRVWWIPFRDQGRGFYALVVIGRNVPPSTVIEVERTLDSLRFEPRHRAAKRWTTTVRADLAVPHPVNWAVATTPLVTDLTDRWELVSVGSAPLPANRPGDPMPSLAVEAMSTSDVLVSIMEWSDIAEAAGLAGRNGRFTARHPFDLAARPPEINPISGIGSRSGFREWWIPFTDGDRYLTALVVIGERATPADVDAAERVLNQFRLR